MLKTQQEYTKIWNDLHCKYIHKYGADKRNELMADHCEELILKAKEVYYNTGNTIMTDATYDYYEDKLRILRPTSKALEKVGT